MNISLELAQLILKAAELREDSYDQKAADKATAQLMFIDYRRFYALPLEEAILQAIELRCADTLIDKPMYLLLASSWNDSLEWAQFIVDNNITEHKT